MKRHTFQRYKKCTEPVYSMKKNKENKEIQRDIPIERIAENGIFQIEPDGKGPVVFDKVYRFTDINFALLDEADKEGVLQKWVEILRLMKMSYKIIVAGIPKGKSQSRQEYLMYPLYAEPIYVLTDKALNEQIQKNYEKGNNDIEHAYYFVISCAKENMEEAILFFNNLENTVLPYFYMLGSKLTALTGMERLQLLQSIYHPRRESYADLTWEQLGRSKDFFKSEICPLSFQASMEHLEMDGRMGSVLLARSYPKTLTSGFMARFIGGLQFPVIAALDMSPLSSHDTMEYCQRKLMNIEGSLDRQQQQNNRRGAFTTDPSWEKRTKKEEATDILDGLQDDNEIMFFTSFLIYVEGKDKTELKSRVERIRQQAGIEGVTFEVFRFQQREAFNTILPLAARQVSVMRQVMIQSMRAFCPFNIAELNSTSPYRFSYGMNDRSKRLLFADKRELKNGNGFVYAPPGSGKSFFVKEEIIQVMNYTEDDVLILDPANEYEDLCDLYEGQFINFTTATDTHINPLWIPDRVYEEEDLRHEFIAEKGIFMQRLFPYIKKKPLEGNEAAYVDRSVKRMYERVFRIYDRSGRREEPTLKEYQKSLEEEEKAQDLLDAFELYVTGSSNVFAHKSNVDINNRMVAFGIRDLGETLRKPSMLIITELMTTRLIYNKGQHKATRVYGDELHVVIDDAEFVLAWEKLWKVARKDGGFATGITQNIADTSMSKQARTMVANSEVLVILSLSKTDRHDLPEIIDLSDAEIAALDNMPKGVGLMKFGNTKVIFDARIEKDNILYWMLTTDPKESREKQEVLYGFRQEIRKMKEEKEAKEQEEKQRRKEQVQAALKQIETYSASEEW